MLFDFDSISKHLISLLPKKHRKDADVLITDISTEVRKCVNGTLTVASMVFVGDSIGKLEEKIKTADWQEVVHPDVMSGCTAFKANVPGLLGIMPIAKLPEDADLFTIDTKKTGFIGIGCTGVQKMPVAFSYLILGMEGDLEVVYTFHPGEPVRPSEIETTDIPAGKKITKEEALSMGFELCKYLSPEEAAKYN